MKIQRINYNGGYLWVDKEAPILDNDKFYNSQEKYVEHQNPNQQNTVEDLQNGCIRYYWKVIAISPNLLIPNVPYVEFEEDNWEIEKMAIAAADEGKEKHSAGYRMTAKIYWIQGYKAAQSKGRYSEDDLRKMFKHGENRGKSEFKDDFLTEDEVIESLNKIPTEIDIVMTRVYEDLCTGGCFIPIATNKFVPATYNKDGKTYLKIKQ